MRRWTKLIPPALLMVTALVYFPSLTDQFVYDDHAQILDNTYALQWDWAPRYFTGHLWSHKSDRAKVYYRPVFMLWLLLNYQWFGSEPVWWHLSSLAVHLLCTWLVFLLARRLTGDAVAAGAGALLFGLHPAHVESVAWVSGIVDPLMAALFLGAFLCYLRGWIAASLALFALAAFEKETALVLPAWILTHAMLFRQGPRLRRALVVAPYAIVAAIYLIVRTAVIQGFHTVINPLPAAVVAATWPAMLCFYLAQLVVPLRLSIFHYVAYVTRLDMAHFVLPVLTLAAIAAGIACWARRDRRALLAATLILFPLLPVLDLTVFTQDEVVHDRYLYLPSVGFCVLAMLAWKRLAPHTAAVVLALPALAMAGITVRESRFWNDDLTLFRHAYQVAPQHYLARQNLGVALLMRGEFADAIPYFQLVLARDPRNPETLYSLGRCYFGLQEWDGAAQYFGEAAAIDPAASNYHLYLGLSDFHASRLDDAEREIRHALDLRPRVSSEFRLYHMSLADVLAGKGQAAAARAEYTAELAENPESLKAFEGSRR